MAYANEPPRSADAASDKSEPALKRLMDNPWMLLALGVAVPTVSYTLWGLAELLSLAAGKLP